MLLTRVFQRAKQRVVYKRVGNSPWIRINFPWRKALNGHWRTWFEYSNDWHCSFRSHTISSGRADCNCVRFGAATADNNGTAAWTQFKRRLLEDYETPPTRFKPSPKRQLRYDTHTLRSHSRRGGHECHLPFVFDFTRGWCFFRFSLYLAFVLYVLIYLYLFYNHLVIFMLYLELYPNKLHLV